MTLDQLRNYGYWLPKSPQQVLLAVMAAGGWKIVFPDKLPRWASRVRNYFNVTPKSLQRLPADAAKRAVKQVQLFVGHLECHAMQTYNDRARWSQKPNPNGKLDPPPLKVPANCPATASKDVKQIGMTDEIGTRLALEGEVYKDEGNRLWYQMAAGSTIFHYGSKVKVKSAEAVGAAIQGQNGVPVFKMVNPDNTGGSNEIIFTNAGYDMIGKVGQEFATDPMLVKTPEHQGSYNFAETIREGFIGHDKLDIKPHSDREGFYLNPDDRFCPLSMRTFPRVDERGRALADQK